MVMENTEKKIGAFVSRVWFLLNYGSYLPHYRQVIGVRENVSGRGCLGLLPEALKEVCY